MARRRRQLRGRRILLWIAVLFALAQLGGGVLLDHVCTWIRFPSAYEALGRLEESTARAETPDVIYFGSSRFGACLNQELLQSTVRCATGDPSARVLRATVPGGEMVSADYLLTECVHRGARPRFILLEIVPEALNHQNAWMRMIVVRQLTWSQVPAFFSEILSTGDFGYLFRTRLAPLYAYRRQILEKLEETCAGAPTVAATGASSVLDPSPEPVGKEVSDAEARRISLQGQAFIRRGLKDYHVGGTSLKALLHLLETCRQYQITALLITPPVTSAYRELLTQASNDPFLACVNRLEAEGRCLFFDCRDALPDRCFVDIHHAGRQGELRFSEKVGREILAPLWHRYEPVHTLPVLHNEGI
jgi:hypothetical protein